MVVRQGLKILSVVYRETLIMTLLFKITVWVLVGLNLLKPFVHRDLTEVIGICAAIILVSGLTVMGNGYKKATVIFLLGGSAMLIYLGAPLVVWLTAAGTLTNVIAILVMMQTFSIPIKAGEYNAAIRYWLNRYFKSEGGLFLFTTVATHVFTSFLMFGAIPVIVSLMEPTLKESVSDYERFMATATSRGYALASLWAPGAINLFLVMQATGISWSSVFIPGVVLSAIGVLVSYFLETKWLLSFRQKQFKSQCQASANDEKQDYGKAVHILWVVVGLIFFTFLFDKLHIGDSSNRIILAGFIVSLSWLTLFIGQPVLKITIKDYWETAVIKAGDLAPFFIAMGIFSMALEQSGILGAVQIHLQALANLFGAFSIIMIPLLVMSAAVIGIHPFITIVMFGKSLTLLQLPVSATTTALCLALGGSISYMVSPFAGVIMTIAKFVGAKAGDVAITWNWLYSLIYFAIGISFAYLWGILVT
jgi:hypothetical protein